MSDLSEISENGPSHGSDAKAAMLKVLEKLLDVPGVEKLLDLPERLQDVIGDTCYGDVKIIIAEGRVQRLKVEKSYP